MSAYSVKALLCDACQHWDDFGIDLQPAKLAEVRRAAARAGWTRAVLNPQDGKADLCAECSS